MGHRHIFGLLVVIAFGCGDDAGEPDASGDTDGGQTTDVGQNSDGAPTPDAQTPDATPDVGEESAVCGNGIVELGEECDDENTADGDGCSASCQAEDPLAPTIVVNPDGSVTMTWQEVADGAGYSIRRDEAWIAGTPQISQSERTLTYTDMTTQPGATYTYKVSWRSTDEPPAFTTIIEETVMIPGGEPPTDGMANLSDRGLLDTRGLRAFPGAEGGGQNSNGGRGGALVIVNTTDCSDEAGDGRVSWKEAWQGTGDVAPGDRTVVFAVGGLFDCGRNTDESFIRAQGEMTVACQTAPSPGVNLAAYRVEYKSEENVIIRGCQFLSHDISGDTASMFRVVTTGSSRNIIADRVTGLHGTDDFTMAFIASNNDTDTMQNITLSNSIIAEGDAYSTHSEAMPATGNPNRYQHSHGPGCSAGLNVPGRQITGCSFIGNLMAHNNRRNPKFWNSSGHVIGNMDYNIGEAGFMVLQRSAPEIDVWFTDNFFKYGPNTRSNIQGNGYRLDVRDSSARVRMERNRYQLPDNGAIMEIPERLDVPENEQLTFHPPRDWTAPGAFDCLGAMHRDANVDRIIQEVRDATGEIGIGTFGNPLLDDGDAGRHWLASEGGDPNYYPETFHPEGYDTDSDGMADAWERANGLNVGVQDHNEDLDGDGYTNIEEFVNSLLRCG